MNPKTRERHPEMLPMLDCPRWDRCWVPICPLDPDRDKRDGPFDNSADGGIKDVGGTLTLGYAPWNNWGITGILGYTLLLGDAVDSPLVDAEGSDGQFLGGVMATYRF